MAVSEVFHGKGFHAVYEDDAILVVHKGPEVLSVADGTHQTDALPERLQAALAARGGSGHVFPVHRLDRNVSGLLLFAKSESVRDALIEQFRAGLPNRVYVAVVQGRMEEPEGRIAKNIDTRARRARAVGRGRGLPAATRYRVLRYGPACTLLRVELETGRKHQIRAHFADIGHPLLGDREFGGPEIHGFDRRRIALHAAELRFQHPDGGRWMEINDPPPPAFDRPFADFDRPARRRSPVKARRAPRLRRRRRQ